MNRNMKVYLVEDEPLARDELKYMLLRTGGTEVVGEAERMSYAIREIPILHPDLVFLDIQLAQGNGLELARELNKLEKPPAIVFVTAYDEHALKAFDLNAADYILKPFDEDRIRRTLDKIAKWALSGLMASPSSSQAPLLSHSAQMPDRKGKLPIMADERILLVELDRIVYAGAEEGHLVIKTLDGEYSMTATLTELEQKLGALPFFRTHRSYIVNLNHVTEVQPWFNGTFNLLLKDGSKVPVSRTYVKELRQAFGF